VGQSHTCGALLPIYENEGGRWALLYILLRSGEHDKKVLPLNTVSPCGVFGTAKKIRWSEDIVRRKLARLFGGQNGGIF
jgi:hypothetical protein